MPRSIIHHLVLLTVAFLLVRQPAEAAKPIPLDQLFPDKIVARGTGFEITDKEVEKAFLDYKTAAAANQQKINPGDQAILESRMLDKLIFMKIMRQKSTGEDQVKGIERADKLLLQYKERTPSEDSFLRYIKSLGLTYPEFKQKFVEQATVEEVLIRELHGRIQVSEDEKKRFYLDNIDRFKQPEMLKAAHILIGTVNPTTKVNFTASQKAAARLKIEGLLKRARSGEEFLGLAKQFSQDSGSKERGGTYIFARGQMAVEFETTAFNLRIGQISDVVETAYGYHVIKLLDREPERTEPYERAQKRVRDMVISRKANLRLPEYTQALRITYRVQILDPKYERKK
jgi:peptidyl-prolyl cis-trans isomerase C